MSERFRDNQPSVLILADFLDGSWHAASFAMQFLYRKKSKISILQTYQNPRMGHFMMRKLSYHLKEITKNELKALRNKLLTNFKIENQEINTLSIEGELHLILNYKQPIVKGPHNIVLCTEQSFIASCNRQNRCVEKVVDSASNPLFILPKAFEENTSKKLLFVGNPDKIPSENLINQVKEICIKSQSGLEILLMKKHETQEIDEDVQSYYSDHFSGIDFSINSIPNKRKSKGLKKYLKNRRVDLIIIENN